MSPSERVALELLAPPFVASVLLSAIFAVLERDPSTLAAAPLILPFAYFVAGLPALAFTLILEVGYRRGLEAGSWRAVRLATLAGLQSGLLVTLWFSPWRQAAPWPGVLLLATLGSATGALTGMLLRARTRSRT